MGDFLKRLVTTIIFVATFLFIARIVSIWLALIIAQVPYTLTSNNNLNLITIDDAQKLTQIVSIADLLFSAAIIVTASIVLARTLLLNDLTRNPRVLVKVIHYNLMGWLEDGKQMYPKLFGWSILLWVATIIVVKNVMQLAVPGYWAVALGLFSIYFTYRVFSFLDKHISDMIGYIYAEKN
jgi:hypothetical protein